MSMGIYKLFWEPDRVYIGKSENLHRRFLEHHARILAGTHHSYKVNKEYQIYGIPPDIEVIEECSSIEEMFLKEVEYIRQFNSYSNGLNCTQGGDGRSDPGSNNSKYSKIQILKVFSMLLSKKYTTVEIVIRTKVKEATIKGIKGGRQHLFLLRDYPELHANLSSSGRRTSLQDMVEYDTRIVTPEGEVILVDNLRQFIKSRPDLLESDRGGISRVLEGRKKYVSCKGYVKYYQTT